MCEEKIRQKTAIGLKIENKRIPQQTEMGYEEILF